MISDKSVLESQTFQLLWSVKTLKYLSRDLDVGKEVAMQSMWVECSGHNSRCHGTKQD